MSRPFHCSSVYRQIRRHSLTGVTPTVSNLRHTLPISLAQSIASKDRAEQSRACSADAGVPLNSSRYNSAAPVRRTEQSRWITWHPIRTRQRRCLWATILGMMQRARYWRCFEMVAESCSGLPSELSDVRDVQHVLNIDDKQWVLRENSRAEETSTYPVLCLCRSWHGSGDWQDGRRGCFSLLVGALRHLYAPPRNLQVGGVEERGGWGEGKRSESCQWVEWGDVDERGGGGEGIRCVERYVRPGDIIKQHQWLCLSAACLSATYRVYVSECQRVQGDHYFVRCPQLVWSLWEAFRKKKRQREGSWRWESLHAFIEMFLRSLGRQDLRHSCSTSHQWLRTRRSTHTAYLVCQRHWDPFSWRSEHSVC